MKIWLVNTCEATPVDEGELRLRRNASLAQVLAKRGHDVTWWNVDFFHMKKHHRFGEDRCISLLPNYRIHFIHGPGYKKNISFQRIRDHHFIGKRFFEEAEKQERPDIILASHPTVDLSWNSVRYGKKHNVPVVVDIRDLWPDLMLELLPASLKPVGKLLLMTYFRQTTWTCRHATHLCANSPKFVEWGLKHADREATKFDIDFPFGYDEPVMTPEDEVEADCFWEKHGIDRHHSMPLICFFGTIGSMFEFKAAFRAARTVLKTHNVRFVFCGDGDRFESYQADCQDEPRIIFPGWVNGKQIWRIMNRSVIALAPYLDNGNFHDNLANKLIEYMAGGLPIMYSIDHGYVADLIRRHTIGLTYGGSDERLAKNINHLLENEHCREAMSRNARHLYLDQYQADAVYGKMADYLENIAAQREFVSISRKRIA